MVQLPRVHPYELDHHLFSTAREQEGPAFALYPFHTRAVVAGKGSDLDREIRISRCLEDGVWIYRRMGGGCSVFLDPGTLVVSLACPSPGISGIQTLFKACACWLLNGLKSIGVEGVYLDGNSDIVIQNKKVGGSCFYRSRGMGYYTASLLVEPDIDGMERYLKFPPRQPDYRENRCHKDFVTSLCHYTCGRDLHSILSALTPHLNTGLTQLV